MATYYGTDGNDYLDYSTETKNLTIHGGPGDDILRGGKGKDTLIGGWGNDTLSGNGGKDTFVVNHLHEGHDVITDADANDVLQLGPGITAGHLSADLNGDDLVLTIIGSWQDPWQRVTLQDWQKRPNDRLAAVTLDGNQGKVSLTALVNHEEGQWKSGAGRLEGTSGHDTLDGDSSNNTIYGYGSDDTLRGYGGDDKLYGGAGSDALGGGEGDDTLYPGPGYDMIKGGEGDDVYVFKLGDGQALIYAWGGDARGLNCCPGWDSSADYGGTDTISFGKGISLNNLRLAYEGYHVRSYSEDNGKPTTLKLEVGDKGDWIGWEMPQPYAIDSTNLLHHKVSFTNGPTLTMEELLAKKPVYFNGTDGNERLKGTGYTEVLSGGKGNDSLVGGLGKDTFFFAPGDGHDVIEDAASDDTIKLGKGIAAKNLSAKLDGDNLVLSISKKQSVTLQDWKTMSGRLTRVTLSNGTKLSLSELLNNKKGIKRTGTSSPDSMKGTPYNDTLDGAGGNDIIKGLAGDDSLVGGTGKDKLYGNDGKDRLEGGAGNDLLDGGNGNDTLKGGAGKDVLHGGDGDDRLYGGTNNDKLYGQNGNDRLYGGAGNDTLNGGAGKDRFVFDTALNKSTNVDTITDFKHREDKIQLKQSIFAKLKAGTLSAANFRASANGVAGDSNDYILYNTKTGALLYDKDGSGKGAAILFATLSDKPKNLTASDFLVIS